MRYVIGWILELDSHLCPLCKSMHDYSMHCRNHYSANHANHIINMNFAFYRTLPGQASTGTEWHREFSLRYFRNPAHSLCVMGLKLLCLMFSRLECCPRNDFCFSHQNCSFDTGHNSGPDYYKFACLSDKVRTTHPVTDHPVWLMWNKKEADQLDIELTMWPCPLTIPMSLVIDFQCRSLK